MQKNRSSIPSLKKRGTTIIMFSLMLFVFLGFTALSVDLGYLFMVRGNLQRAADAAVLAGAQKLPDLTNAISVAQQVAALNLPNQGTVLTTSDIVIGTWNATTQTLTSGGTNLTMSVKIRRTSATQNPVTLFFASLLGVSSRDVTAIAIAEKSYPTIPYGLVGMNNVNLTDGTLIDSYDSSQGSYSASTAGSQGHIATNAGISIGNTTVIKGDARPGPGYSISGNGTITGSRSPLTTAMQYKAVSAPTSYNNNGFQTNLNVSSGSVTMPPGTYYSCLNLHCRKSTINGIAQCLSSAQQLSNFSL